MAENMTGNGFDEYRRLILTEIEHLRENDKETQALLRELIKDVSALKVKSGTWGAVSGAITGILTALSAQLRQ